LIERIFMNETKRTTTKLSSLFQYAARKMSKKKEENNTPLNTILN
jgi:hypothetical protein